MDRRNIISSKSKNDYNIFPGTPTDSPNLPKRELGSESSVLSRSQRNSWTGEMHMNLDERNSIEEGALTYADADGRQGAPSCRERYGWIFVVVILTCVLVAVIYGPTSVDEANHDTVLSQQSTDSFRLAFGSCSGYDQRPQPIWADSVIPSTPDAWIWLGDMAYLDHHGVNCDVEPGKSGSPYCNCTYNWYRTSQTLCGAGDTQNAIRRWKQQVLHPHYLEFLEYMCPSGMAQGIVPPPGSDPELCSRAIIGTWDDHDFGANNANRRLPNKNTYKELFLDAIGESKTSPRRNALRGMYWKQSLFHGQVDVILLDERYDRDPLPCYVSRDFCEKEVFPIEGHQKTEWCKDFLYGGDYGGGSCCKKDEEIFYGWCLEAQNKESPNWSIACDPTDPDFATRALVLKDGELVEPDGTEYYDMYQDSPICEMLGRQQRAWLRQTLEESQASVKIIASGSVVLAKGNPANGSCSSDDFDCYRPAQLQLLHTISNAPGCSIIVTGDFHYSDIKVLKPGPSLYSEAYGSENIPYNLFQVMSSGLTDSTAKKLDCSHEFRMDPTGLRDRGECDYVDDPSFGYIDVLYDEKGSLKNISMHIKSGLTESQSELHSFLDVRTCNTLPP